MNIDELISFLLKASELKIVPRSGWVNIGIDNPESVAEHSFQTALITLLICDLKELNTLKAIKMALLHDLSEAILGDMTPLQKKKFENYNTKVRQSMNALLSKLPENICQKYLGLWKEYEENSSPEANIVHDADKIEMIMQAIIYERSGINSRSLETFWSIDLNDGFSKDIYNNLKVKRGKIAI